MKSFLDWLATIIVFLCLGLVAIALLPLAIAFFPVIILLWAINRIMQMEEKKNE